MTKTTIYYKYGVMNSGKSMDLLKIAYNYEENGIYPLILKPHIDSRVAEKIYSRVGLEKDAIEISAETDISKLITPNIEVILIDESQFLEPEVIDKIVYEAYNKNIKTLMFFGLKNDFRGLLFDGSKRIIEIADKIEESTSICWCGKKARQNARIINGEMSKNGDIIMIDNEKDIEYITLCNYHYFTNNIGKKRIKMKKLIKKYTQLDGISGNEYQIAEKLFEKFSTKNPAEIYRDNLGGIACKINNSGKINIGIFAHMDEVGLMVKNIYETGDVEIIPIGGITIDFLIGQRLKFVDKKGKEYIGVVLASSPHLKDEKPKNISELRVSFGFEKREDALKIGMGKGSFLHFIGNFTEMQNNKIMTKAADNRIGVAVIEALYDYLQGNEISHNVILGATVQEEIGLKGANPLLNAVDENFDLILIVDVSPIDNYPDCKLGEGPLLRIAEPRGVYDREMTQFIQQIADKNKIKLQPYFSKGRTDGAAMQINQKGNSVAALCIPALNLHTNSTIFDLNDVNNCFELVKEILNEEFTNRK